MRHLARITAVALLCTVFAAPSPAHAALADACPASLPDPAYPDVRADSVHYEAIGCITWWEITLGTGFGTYEPGGTVGRDQMASFIARLVERLGGALPRFPTDQFDDVRFDNPHEDNINRLAEVGLVQGVGPGSYGPDRIVTRAQMATFLVRAYEFANNRSLPLGPDRFADDDGTTHEDNINKAAAAGFASGSTDGRYRPSGAVTRAQMATFMARVLGFAVGEGSAFLPVESVTLSGQSGLLSDPLRLRSGTYTYAYDHSGDCFYDPRLTPENDEEFAVFLESGLGPDAGEVTFTDVLALQYRFEMNAGGAEPCSWSMTLERTGP